MQCLREGLLEGTSEQTLRPVEGLVLRASQGMSTWVGRVVPWKAFLQSGPDLWSDSKEPCWCWSRAGQVERGQRRVRQTMGAAGFEM